MSALTKAEILKEIVKERQFASKDNPYSQAVIKALEKKLENASSFELIPFLDYVALHVDTYNKPKGRTHADVSTTTH